MAVENNKQTLTVTAGLNSDTSQKYFGAGESPYRYSVRVLSTNSGVDGDVEAPLGNTLVSYTLPTGNNTCIGYREDKLRKRGYARIYNDRGNHSLLEYDEVLNTITPYFIDDVAITGATTGSVLNFHKENLITGGAIVELNKDNYLDYFSDNYINPNDASDYNEPRKINIEAGKLFVSGDYSGQYSFPFQKKFLDDIKEPPPAPSYTWSGLDTNTDSPQVSAKGTVGVPFVTNSLVDVPVNFPLVLVNAPPQYVDPTETIPADGYYVVDYLLHVKGDTVNAVTNIIFSFKVNGVAIKTVGMNILSNAAQYDQSIQLTNHFFSNTAGDVFELDVKIDTTSIFGAGIVISTLSYFKLYYLGVSVITNLNDLFKRNFLFQAAYGYKDKEVSVLSKKSGYVFPATLGQSPSTGEDFVFQDNIITISVWSGGSNVQDIRIYGSELNTPSPLDTLLSTVSLIITLNKKQLGIADNIFYNYIFLNDGNYTPVNLQDATQLMDFVPVRNQSEEMAKNFKTWGLVTESQDAVDVDMRFSLTYEQTNGSPTNPFYPAKSFLKSGGSYVFGLEDNFGQASVARLSTCSTTPGSSDTFNPDTGKFGTTLRIPFLTESTYNAPHGTPNLDMQYVPDVRCLIYNHPPVDALTYDINRSKNQAISNYIQFLSQDCRYIAADGVTVLPNSVGAWAVHVSIANIIGRYKTENPASLLVYDFTKGDRIRFIADSMITSTIKVTDQINTFFSYNDTEIAAFDVPTQMLTVKMTPSVPLNLSGQLLFEIYTPAKVIENDNELLCEVGEGGIIGIDANGNKIYIPNPNGFLVVNQLFENFNNAILFAADTYKVTKLGAGGFAITNQIKITGTGGVWSIYGTISNIVGSVITVDTTGFTLFDPLGSFATVHTGEIVRAAYQKFTSGDCFRRLCDMPFLVPPALTVVGRVYNYIETMNASNMFVSNAWDYGRPNRISNLEKRRTTQERIVYSENILPDTNVNGLSKVYDLNFVDYNRPFGGFQKLFFKNDYLYGFQNLKILPIPVLRQILQSAGGDGGVVSSAPPKLSSIQDVRYYVADIGIGVHPESHANNEGRQYCFSVQNAAVVRLAQDGIINLPMEANMAVDFANLCEKILNAVDGGGLPTKVNCPAVYDVRFGTYILSISPFTYKIVGGTASFAGATIEFNEDNNAFATWWPYIPDMMGQSGVDIISLKNGQLYTHNTNPLVNNFYGVQYDSILEFVCNAFPDDDKVYLSLEEISDDVWICEKVTCPNGQETRMMYPSNWETKEGYHYAYFKKDINTPVVTNPIVNGNVMRDTTCRIRLKYSGTTPTTFHALNVYFTNSPRHNQ